MLPEGKSRLFVPGGAGKEGPYPERYEALECPPTQPPVSWAGWPQAFSLGGTAHRPHHPMLGKL